MKSNQTFNLIDEVKEHLKAVCRHAKTVVPSRGDEPVEPADSADACAALPDGFMQRRVELRRAGQTIIKVPPPLALLVLLIGVKKPKLLLAGGAALLATRTDIALVCPEFEVSVKDSLFSKSKAAAGNVQDMKERLDDRFHDLKEQGFHRETEPGQRYFTIKL